MSPRSFVALWTVAQSSWARARSTVAGLLLIFATLAHGQVSQFAFDANGNLQANGSESIALPEILGQPQPQVAAPGALASFFVVAANTRDLTYQWRFNGTNIDGANNDALLLQDIGASNEGSYSVVLINPSGSVTSAPAALLLDGDGDGLPDSWELVNFGNLSQATTGDFDRDGVSNADEFLDGTNPANRASARFRLTVLSDGGLVTVAPARVTYTNGETVTLTASNPFRAWTGDTHTTNNPITLTMTTNRTVFAHMTSLNLTWTNLMGGEWDVASNWKPNFVPMSNDSVFITEAVRVTNSSAGACRSLVLGGPYTPTLTGSGTLTLHGESFWVEGTMGGTGRTVVAPGATLTLQNFSAVNLNTTRTLENAGTILWTGGNISMNGGVITNRATALFEAQSAATQSGPGRFDNAGTFRILSPGTTTVGGTTAFNNYGGVEIQRGELALHGGSFNAGTIEVQAGATLNLSGGTLTSSAASSISGAGDFVVSGATATLAGLVNPSGNHVFSGGTANLNGNYICTNNVATISGGSFGGIANINGTGTVAVMNLNGTLGGSGVLTVLHEMNWFGGTMRGSGRTVIAPEAALNLVHAGAAILSGRTLENAGTTLWTGTGNLSGNSAVITNRTGALFEVRNNASFIYQGGGASRFDNAGTFRKSGNSGITALAVRFNNYNRVEIRNGILAANGVYTSTSNALLHCALGGTTAGTGFGQLQVAGTVNLTGSLGVDLVNGYSPAINDSFAILTAGTRSGVFATLYYPSNTVTMQMSHTANSVIVGVTDVLAVPRPMLLPLELVGPNLRLTWTAVSNTMYRLEYKSHLGLADWSILPGDVTGLSNTANKLDMLTTSNRLYRVRVITE